MKFKDKVITPANYTAYFFVVAKSQNAADDGVCGIVRCARIDGVDTATFTPVHIPTGKANMMISSSTNNLICTFTAGTAASFLILRMGY